MKSNNKIPRDNPFAVPDGYFDQLTRRVEEKAINEPHKNKFYTFPYVIAVAAIGLLLIGFSFFLWLNDSSEEIKGMSNATSLVQEPRKEKPVEKNRTDTLMVKSDNKGVKVSEKNTAKSEAKPASDKMVSEEDELRMMDLEEVSDQDILDMMDDIDNPIDH